MWPGAFERAAVVFLAYGRFRKEIVPQAAFYVNSVKLCQCVHIRRQSVGAEQFFQMFTLVFLDGFAQSSPHTGVSLLVHTFHCHLYAIFQTGGALCLSALEIGKYFFRIRGGDLRKALSGQ